MTNEHLFLRQVEPFTNFVKREVPDPRKNRGRKYDFILLIEIIIIGLIVGKTDLVAISNYFKENFEEFNTLIGLESAPSHDCLNDLINSINPDFLEAAFEDWVDSYYKPKGLHQISGDGTYLNASTRKIREGKQPNLVNFISVETGLILANELTFGKGKRETEAFKRVLKRLKLKEALITADALNCTQWIMEYISEQGGYFFFPVKNDKRKLKQRIIETLIDELDSVESYHQDLILDHGTLVDRRIYLSENTQKLKMKAYPYLKQFGIIESTRLDFIYTQEDVKKVKDVSFKYYGVISNFSCRAQKAAMIKLDEWKVETFHRYKDIFLNEDHSTYKSQTGIMVMAILRRVAYNYLILVDKLISNFNRESFSEKSIFLDAHKDLLVMLVDGYNPDYPLLMQNYHQKKAQSYLKLGQRLKNKDVPASIVLNSLTDLFDF